MQKILAMALLITAAAAGGCKKKGGGGAWLVGEDGLMANVREDGTLGPGYDLGGTEDLFGIGCRGDAGFVVGEGGTFLRTYDGETWEAIDVGTTAALRDVAVAWDAVYIAGDDGLRVSRDDGDSWELVTGGAWRAVTTTAQGDVALALDDTGTAWRWDGVLAPVDAAGTAISLSRDGDFAALVGAGGALAVSDDGGATWRDVDSGTAADLHAVSAGAGTAVAAGAAGTIVRFSDDIVVSTPTTGSLRAVHLHDAHGFAAGDGGAVLLTHDNGASWAALLTLDRNVRDLDEID
jgi:photosystem II stability/assembly factor-like uncharacterized protein